MISKIISDQQTHFYTFSSFVKASVDSTGHYQLNRKLETLKNGSTVVGTSILQKEVIPNSTMCYRLLSDNIESVEIFDYE